LSDTRGSADFRREMARVTARRALGQLFGLRS
jgi:CO/xanthine dehydrogenase FAD-binding subunit